MYAGNDYDAYYERNVVSFKIHENFERGLDDDHANENDLCLLEMDKNILFSSEEQLDTGKLGLYTYYPIIGSPIIDTFTGWTLY